MIKTRIEKLQTLIKENNLYAYLVPTTDYHGSEYVNPYFRAREYLTGFTGSAGELLVTQNEAFLWTDSRYFIQAEKELEGSGIELMKIGQAGVVTLKDWISKNCKGTLGFDSRLISAKDGVDYSKVAAINGDLDFINELWQDRPALISNPPYKLPEDLVGESSESKLARVRQELKAQNADFHLITNLEDIAWLNNMRGTDIPFTPVFYAFELISQEAAKLYVHNPHEFQMPGNIEICPYDQIYEDIAKYRSGTVLIDDQKVNYRLYSSLSQSMNILSGLNPAEKFKAVKNPVEIENTKEAHIKDGVAMVNFIYWLKSNIGVLPISEISASDYLELQRRMQPGFIDLSFDTICGYNKNGAIVHYSASPESNQTLQSMGLLLVDSGAHYTDGTTDITRTIVLGPLTHDMKKHYTAVLKGHIQLAMAHYDNETTGADLDKIARTPITDMGLNYGHGTGHGVGHVLSVHEGPLRISPTCTKEVMKDGMITSNEPGIYIEGQYGIRLENEILSINGHFETITYCPFDKDAIIFEELTEEEFQWLKDYHDKVFQILSPYLQPDEKQWLRQQLL